MIGKILFIAAVLIYYEVESREDAILSELKQTLKQNRAWHITSVALLAIWTMIMAYGFFGFTWVALIVMLLVGTLRMSFFNMRLNAKRGKNWHYLGENGWDGLFSKNSRAYHIFWTMVSICGIILLFIIC